MMLRLIPVIFVILTLISFVNTSGTLGYKTIANVAIHSLLPQILTSVSSILSADPTKSTPNPTLVEVANWADNCRYTTAGNSPLFSITSTRMKNPPKSCGVDFARDCSGVGGCIITAIPNYVGGRDIVILKHFSTLVFLRTSSRLNVFNMAASPLK